MFRFSKKVDYTVLLLTELVSSEGVLRSAASLADQFGLSPEFVAKLLKTLVRKGFIESVRGKHGGYKLKIDPEQISLRALIQAVDGPVSLTDCSTEKEHDCRISHLCGSRAKMLEITLEINRILDNVYVSQILEANHVSKPNNLGAGVV